MTDYTEQDVELAVKVAMQPRMHTNRSGDAQRYDMRAVLDAVAPRIATRAKAEALREAALDLADSIRRLETYRTPDAETAEVTLRGEQRRLNRRADEIERGAS